MGSRRYRALGFQEHDPTTPDQRACSSQCRGARFRAVEPQDFMTAGCGAGDDRAGGGHPCVFSRVRAQADPKNSSGSGIARAGPRFESVCWNR